MNRNRSFIKMVGTGNDFVLLDHRTKKIPSASYSLLSRRLTHRQNGIGADGVLFLEKSTPKVPADFKMRIFNPDGSEAEMCGNGIRCIAYYAYQEGIVSTRMKIETLAGVLSAEVKKNRVRVELSLPKEWKPGLRFQKDGVLLEGVFVNTGTPHAVFFVHSLENLEVAKLGAFVRYHPDFAPRGTNVNFVESKNSHQIQVRTYERGVEAETLACGTGATASALVAAKERKISTPINVLTQSGETLTVDFQQESGEIHKVWLEGAVKIVFKGEIENV